MKTITGKKIISTYEKNKATLKTYSLETLKSLIVPAILSEQNIKVLRTISYKFSSFFGTLFPEARIEEYIQEYCSCLDIDKIALLSNKDHKTNLYRKGLLYILKNKLELSWIMLMKIFSIRGTQCRGNYSSFAEFLTIKNIDPIMKKLYPKIKHLIE